MDLSGKVAVVTGSGRGLGLAYASRLAACGASVVVNDVDADVAERAAVADPLGRRHRGREVAAPVGSSESAQPLVDRAVGEYGRLDVLVTNAGILRDTGPVEDDRRRLRRRRSASTCAARSPAPGPRPSGCASRATAAGIICVGSPTGQVGNFGQTNYAAAKAGIVGMVANLGDGARPRRDHRQRRSCRWPPPQ